LKVAIALGSNLGDRLATLRSAIVELGGLSRQPLRKSRLYETAPVDCPPGSMPFLNAVVELEVDDQLSPHDLLRKLQAIEAKLGRKQKVMHNEPRPIDLDMICFGEQRVNAADLVLPHPRAHLRKFVLQPFSDLSPDLILPGQTMSVAELLGELRDGPLTPFAEPW
jgi:2-amino-4-hydroxy-6-hydroxymethyldihydropteridine diphosphokinase